MRLIDADMLTERITMLNDADLFTIGRVIASIDTQPTAFDIDKVVEEAENRLNRVLDDEKRISYEQGSQMILKIC